MKGDRETCVGWLMTRFPSLLCLLGDPLLSRWVTPQANARAAVSCISGDLGDLSSLDGTLDSAFEVRETERGVSLVEVAHPSCTGPPPGRDPTPPRACGCCCSVAKGRGLGAGTHMHQSPRPRHGGRVPRHLSAPSWSHVPGTASRMTAPPPPRRPHHAHSPLPNPSSPLVQSGLELVKALAPESGAFRPLLFNNAATLGGIHRVETLGSLAQFRAAMDMNVTGVVHHPTSPHSAHTHTQCRAFTHTCRAHIHIHMHACTRTFTYIHTHIHTPMCTPYPTPDPHAHAPPPPLLTCAQVPCGRPNASCTLPGPTARAAAAGHPPWS